MVRVCRYLVRVDYGPCAVFVHDGALDECGARWTHRALSVHALHDGHLRLGHLCWRHALALRDWSRPWRFIFGLRDHTELAD